MKKFSPFLTKRPNRAIIVVEAMHKSNSNGLKNYMQLHPKERQIIESVIMMEQPHG